MLRHRESGYLNQSASITESFHVDLTGGAASVVVWSATANREIILKGFRVAGVVVSAMPLVPQILAFADTASGNFASAHVPIYPIEGALGVGFQFVASETAMGDGIGFGVGLPIYLRLDNVIAAGGTYGLLRIKGVMWGEKV